MADWRFNRMAFSMLWQSRVTSLLGYEKPLTKKDVGQLNTLAEHVGERAPQLIEFVLAHWGTFAMEARGAVGLHNAPAHPRISFLVMCEAVAVRMFDAHEKALNRPPMATVAPKLSATRPPEERPYKPTLEEMATTMASI